MTQVALGVVLLIAAGLLVRTFSHLRNLDPGFNAHGVVTASVSLQDARYRTVARVSQLFDDTLSRVSQAPGVEAAAVSLGLPCPDCGARAPHPAPRSGQGTQTVNGASASTARSF